MSLKYRLFRNLSNIPGWITNKKIVVFDSDDWGSIRMSSKESRDELMRYGFNFENQSFNLFDRIESNDDIELLYETLSKFKDGNGNHPVFTAVNIVANPDFDKIRAGGFKEYFFEPFTKTLESYSDSDKVYKLYKEGIERKLFVPVFHGREHLNVQRWMRVLQTGNESIHRAFDHRITSVFEGVNGEFLGDFQAAFDPDFPEDIIYMQDVLADGLELFEKLWGYKSSYFVPTNGPFNNSLEEILHKNKVKYILGERIQHEPYGNAKYKKHIHYIGQKNKYNQRYLTRNGFFEPSIMQGNLNVDPVGGCLKSIERAFRWGKPAVISTHRVNFIGSIDENNRAKTLTLLAELLKKIITRWPDVEFRTSMELGDIISKSNK
jgi:hypothetical protein